MGLVVRGSLVSTLLGRDVRQSRRGRSSTTQIQLPRPSPKRIWFARPIQGLFSVYDLNTNAVLEVMDTGVVTVPNDAWVYMLEDIEARRRRRRVVMDVRARGAGRRGIRHRRIGREVGFWRFRYCVDKRQGVILSEIEVNDMGTWRYVGYEAHLSEVFVPYMDTDVSQYYRTCEYGYISEQNNCVHLFRAAHRLNIFRLMRRHRQRRSRLPDVRYLSR